MVFFFHGCQFFFFNGRIHIKSKISDVSFKTDYLAIWAPYSSKGTVWLFLDSVAPVDRTFQLCKPLSNGWCELGSGKRLPVPKKQPQIKKHKQSPKVFVEDENIETY